MPSPKLKKPLPRSKLPQQKHCKFLDLQERIAVEAFETIHKKIIEEVEGILEEAVLEKSVRDEFESLKKSEDERLMRRWTGKVPRISLNVSEKVEERIKYYLKALRYLFLGKAAGRDAKAVAEKVFGKKVPPGIIFGTYLQAIDTEREYYETLFKEDAPKIPFTIIKKSFEIIARQSERSIDQALDDYKNRVLDTVDVALAQHRFDNLFAVAEEAHDLKDKHNKPDTIERAAEEASAVDESDVVAQLQDMTAKAKENTVRWVRYNLGQVSAVGSHQAMVEIFGAHDDRMKVALVNIRDGRCCDQCEKWARNPDGSFKLYSPDEFAAAGSNSYKKRSEWVLCVPSIHIGCRCRLLHVPKGFKITPSAEVVPE